jgi:phosphohistidine phosphatase
MSQNDGDAPRPAAAKIPDGRPRRAPARPEVAMELLVVRHAIAEDRDEFARTGKPDGERPLTADGRRKFAKAARGLHRLVDEVDLLATSGLRRADETAELLVAEYGRLRTVRQRALEPDAAPAALLAWLKAQRRRGTVVVVGHEPHLSALVELLLAGRSSGFVELRKGGACLLALPRPAAAGGAELRWLLTAAQLRRLAR